MNVNYDPGKRFEVKAFDVEYRRTEERPLLARIYQPQGEGPFPVLLGLHGGAWNNQDRTANAPVDEAIAASGILLVAIDLRRAPQHPYPASIQDANYGTRWLKAHAREYKGDPETIGAFGSSSGGHEIQLSAMRPFDSRYCAIPLPEAPGLDATLNYVVARSPISDPFARYQQAQKMKREFMINNSHNYFQPWETITGDANPQKILESGEKVALPPMIVLQGGTDDNVIPVIQERFVEVYRAVGGDIQLEVFANMEHRWVIKPGPETDRAIEVIKAFIARQLGALQPVG